MVFRLKGLKPTLRETLCGSVALALTGATLAFGALSAEASKAGESTGSSLQKLTKSLASTPSKKLRSGQFFLMRTVERDHSDPSVYEERTWRSSDGTGRRVWIKNGDVLSDRKDDQALHHEGDIGLSYQEVLALPTDPETLADRLREIAATPEPVADPETMQPTGKYITLPPEQQQREMVLDIAGLLGLNLPIPSDLRAALIQVLQQAPDVRHLGPVTDHLGRPGIAFAIDGKETNEHYGRALILNPVTGYLQESFDYRHGNLKKVAGFTTVQRRIVDDINSSPW